MVPPVVSPLQLDMASGAHFHSPTHAGASRAWFRVFDFYGFTLDNGYVTTAQNRRGRKNECVLSIKRTLIETADLHGQQHQHTSVVEGR